MGEGGTSETSTIGDPIFTLSNTLKSNEIWLEGQELLIAKYRKLYQVYGTTYGEASDTLHFKVPDFRNRSIWGVSSTDTLGYIEGAIPNITGNIGIAAQTFGRPYTNGAFLWTSQTFYCNGANGNAGTQVNFNAARCSALYKDVTYNQPTSLAVRVKCKAK